MVSHALTVLAVVAFAVAVLEVCLSVEQKEGFNIWALQVWDILDDWKKTRWMRWFNSPKTQVGVVAVSAIAITTTILWIHYSASLTESEKPAQVPLWIAAFISLGNSFYLVRYPFRARTLWAALLRATGLLIFLLLPVAGAIAIMFFYRDALMPAGEANIFQMLWLIFFMLSFLITLPLSIVWM